MNHLCWFLESNDASFLRLLPLLFSLYIPSFAPLWPPLSLCTLLLHFRFSLHSPTSLPDSWPRLCCISHTESNAITVSARGATFIHPGRGPGTGQRPPSSRDHWQCQQPVSWLLLDDSGLLRGYWWKVYVGESQVCRRWSSRKPLVDDGTSSGDVPKDRQLEPWGTPWRWLGKHDQLSGRKHR